MRIRAFEWQDYSRAQALLAAVHSFHAEQRPDIYKPVHTFSSQEYYAQLMHQPALLSAVAEEDLMNYVKVRAKALELDGLNLSVAAFNTPARALYEKLGFTTKSEKLEWNMKQEKEIVP